MSSAAPWEPFTDRHGRAFVRMNLPGAEFPGAAFTIAQPLADRYRVDDLMTIGESSVLLRARDLRTRRGVVIKALRTDSLRIPDEVADRAEVVLAELRRLRHLLQTERRLLVRLRNAGCNGVPHPNDYVYDRNPGLEGIIGDEALIEAEPYLVLEHLAGVCLEELIERVYPSGMDEARALGLIGPVVRVLEVLHDHWRHQGGRTWHCVYQDLKPANIVVDPMGRPRLLDFGGCQVVVDGVPVLEGAFTPGYCPPECLGPARVLLPCADVYGIGATLYHMLTGIDPRRPPLRMRSRRGPGEPPDLRALPRRLSPGMQQVLARCLAPRHSDRFADARQVAQALAPLVGRTMNLAPAP